MTSPIPRVSRAELRADCSRCAGLCCVAPTFVRSADFAISKASGTPCPHLQDDYGCGIHATLSDRGFRGCAVFDCFGAGQHLVQQTFGGRTWRTDPALAPTMFAAFDVLRALSEMLWHLAEAAEMPSARPDSERIDALRERIEGLTRLPADAMVGLDVAPHRRTVGDLLSDLSERARAHFGPDRFDGRHGDFVGADLRRTDLRGAALRGALLLGADLRGGDLRGADLLGADLRRADLRGADLSRSIFLTQPQVNAARGDGSTRIPAVLATADPVADPVVGRGGNRLGGQVRRKPWPVGTPQHDTPRPIRVEAQPVELPAAVFGVHREHGLREPAAGAAGHRQGLVDELASLGTASAR